MFYYFLMEVLNQLRIHLHGGLSMRPEVLVEKLQNGICTGLFVVLRESIN